MATTNHPEHGKHRRQRSAGFAAAAVVGKVLGTLVLIGVITCAIRFWGNMAEGVSFSLLIMNLLVPYINDLTRQKPLGGVKSK